MLETDFAQALVGLPIAVVIIALVLYAWKLLRDGTVVLGREYDEMRTDRNLWRSVAMRSLNIGESVIRQRTPEWPMDDDLREEV